MKEITLLIPAYNEEPNIDLVINEIEKHIPREKYNFTALFVDDGSQDKTWDKIMQTQSTQLSIEGIRFSRNFGKENALIAGIEHLDCDAVIIMDCDLQHPPSAIPEFLKEWESSGKAIVNGLKRDRGRENIFYRMLASVFYGLFFSWTGYDLKTSSDFKLLDRRVIAELQHLQERNLLFRGLTSWLGFPSSTIQYDTAERRAGKASMSLSQRIDLARSSLTSFSVRPLRLVFKIGGFFLVGAAILIAYTLYLKFTGQSVEGFSTVIILQLVIGGSIMLGLSIIGEYIAQIYDEVKKRPRYVVADRKEKDEVVRLKTAQ